MLSEKITLAALEDYIRSRRRGLRFPAALEENFELQRRRYLARVALNVGWRSLIIYNVFLPVDFLLAPGTFWLSLTLHLLVISPLIILVAMLVRQGPGWVLRDSLAASIPVLIMCQIMLIFHLNSGAAAAAQYQYMAMLVPVFSNIYLHLDFRSAVLSSAVLSLLYLVILFATPAGIPVTLVGTALMLGSVYVSLGANHQIERNNRYAHLRRLADQMLRDEAANEASRDALTGLANRRALDRRTDELWEAHVAVPVAVVMVDVDHFKLFNDFYGHPAGDVCLKRVAGAIASELRGENDLAVRFGGEEFVLLLPDTDLAMAVQIGERVRRAIEALAVPHETSPTSDVVTASLGVAAAILGAKTAAMLVAGADAALYEAKRNGRNQVWPPPPPSML